MADALSSAYAKVGAPGCGGAHPGHTVFQLLKALRTMYCWKKGILRMSSYSSLSRIQLSMGVSSAACPFAWSVTPVGVIV